MQILNDKNLVLIVFVLVYLYLIFSKHHRGLAVGIGVGILLVVGPLSIHKIIHFINWNVIGIFAGTLIVAELFIYSRVPMLLADILVNRSKTVGMAILWVCVMSSLLSSFVENVATVLILAPIAMALSKKLHTSPVPFLITIAICSNLQGTATLIGDPPSMILAGYERMNFNDFFIYHSKPSIFFAVEAGAIVSFGVLYLMFRKIKTPISKIPYQRPLTWVPTYMLIYMIVALALSPIVDPEFSFVGGLICMIFGIVGLAYHAIRDKENALRIIKQYDWDTTFFLCGVFILVGLLEETNWINDLKDLIITITGTSTFTTYTFVVWFSILISAFIDNVPYITAMIPVTQKLGMALGGNHELVVFGLLIGSCLGGNITPIGASANIVATGILKKAKYPISFWTFVKIGLPFTVAATSAAYVFLWLIWR